MMHAPQPLRVDHFRETLKERVGLTLDLLRKAEVRGTQDVLKTVLAGNRNVAAVRDEVDGLGNAKL